MDIRKAYKVMMTGEDGMWVGLTYQSVLNARYRVRKGEYPSEPTMRKRLKAAGWKRKKMVEDWEK